MAIEIDRYAFFVAIRPLLTLQLTSGLDECDLEVVIEVNIPSIYSIYLKDYVDVTYEAEISY